MFPAVIVGIVDRQRDRVLVSRYAGREYTSYALIAGFSEMGETVEQTVHREVMEEVGLKVTNLRYYKRSAVASVVIFALWLLLRFGRGKFDYT